ncbi:lysine histidine transporter-like 8 [Chenopodium quinoa]|uniref:lysine histidine transporter-like 8 n=1 Tax=Chenopodium quinoa TaxID=63459 RepID=UPI000B78E6BA|nr:lysine histidine transporter-like 8 [Chenopodium quinoa]
MEIPKWHTTLEQLMQEEIERDRQSVKSSSRSIDIFPISIINYESSSRSIRINPVEDDDDELDFDDHNRLHDNIVFVSGRKELVGEVSKNPEAEAWLPITESRNGNLCFCIFHLLSSGLGLQSLALPVAFTTLGWAWGITWLSIAFIWQLYTIWLLTQLHESPSGFRYSRYLQLAMAAFGPKLGKLLALLPVMYLSGGTCVTLLITGGGTMQHLYHILCENDNICHAKSLTTVEWYMVFICLAIVIAQLPNLNSVAWVSLVSAISAVVYCTIIWIMSISNGRPSGTKYSLSARGLESEMKSFTNVLSALGIIAFSFRGHNLVLEIQGTLPPSLKDPTHKIMWKGVKITYALIALCLFPLAIGGYWAYGTLMPNTGMLKAFAQFHGNHSSRLKLALIYFFLIINSLCSFQVYAMPVFDNFELRYVSIQKKPCTWWIRAGLRVFFGGLVFFIAVAVPFLPVLAPLIGGIALPVTFAYPCFMWIIIKKPSKFSTMWFLNLVLGSLGILLSVLLIVAAIYNLVTKGLSANFFHPKP